MRRDPGQGLVATAAIKSLSWRVTPCSACGRWGYHLVRCAIGGRR